MSGRWALHVHSFWGMAPYLGLGGYSAVAWLQIRPEVCKLSLQALKYIFVFIKCNRASQDTDTFLILKKILTPSQAILYCHKIYISASIWDISTKFGLLIDFDLLKALTSTDTKPEVVFSCRGRHLEKCIWRHTSAVGASIWMKFGSLIENNVQISGKWSKSKPKVDFQYGGRLFFKNGASWPWFFAPYKYTYLLTYLSHQ